MNHRQVRRLDLGQLRPVIRREDGTILADAHLTRCGIFNYLQPDGTVRRELREREQVQDPESLASFLGRPVTVEHPPVMLDATNAKKYAVGAIQGDVYPDDDHVRSRLSVFDADAIAAMERGKTQVSCGYVCDLDETPGVHPEFGPYDARQLNIRGNHLALVDVARAGGTARVRLDAAERVDTWSDEAREAAAEARHAAAGKAGEAANAATVKAVTKGKGHDKAAALHRAAAEAARAAGDKAGAKEHERQAKEHERQAAKPADKQALEEFQRMRAAHENNEAEAEFAKRRKTAELAKYVTKKDAGILGRGDSLAACKNRAKLDDMASDANPDKDATGSETQEGSPTRTKAAKGRDTRKAKGGSPDASPAKDATADKGQAGKSATDSPDDDDEAERNARGENDADAKDKGEGGPGPESTMHGEAHEHDDDADDKAADADADDDDDDEDDDSDDDDDEGDDDEDEDKEDAYDASYNKDGDLTAEARHKLATSSFAVPDREGLPIHDPEHTRAAMARFGQYEFKSPEERHAAFNRITKRAKHFGVSSEGFEKAHRSTLDHQDSKMIKSEKIRAANRRADAAEAALAKAQGEAASTKKDLDAARAQLAAARKDAADAYDKRVEAKVALLAQASATGAKVDASMKDVEIKRAVVKHVDGEDVPVDKPEPYVDAMYDGAIRRAKTDAQATAAGAAALAAARAVTAPTAPGATTPAPHNDADDLDEVAAARRARLRSANAWTQEWVSPHARSRQETK